MAKENLSLGEKRPALEVHVYFFNELKKRNITDMILNYSNRHCKQKYHTTFRKHTGFVIRWSWNNPSHNIRSRGQQLNKVFPACAKANLKLCAIGFLFISLLFRTSKVNRNIEITKCQKNHGAISWEKCRKKRPGLSKETTKNFCIKGLRKNR